MSGLPSTGQDPWDSTLNAYLTTEHNTDGTHKGASLAQVSGLASGHEFIYDGTKVINILHKRRAGGFSGIKGDGVTDDSAAIATAMNEINIAGKGWFEFEPYADYRAGNIPIYPKSTIDMQACRIQLPNGSAAGSDVFRTLNFNTLVGGGTTGGPTNWRLIMNGGEIHGNRANNASGRHGIAAYGVGNIENPGFIHECHGSAAWAEWSSTASQLSALGLGLGDQTFVLDGLKAYDCDMATAISGLDATIVGGITGVTNATNPTITTAQYHLLRPGQSVTISGVVGATGVNGTKTVLATPSATTFTITNAAPGPYSSGGAITTPRAGMIVVKNVDSPWLNGLEIYQTGGVKPGTFGVVCASSGAVCERLHIYQDFAGAIDVCNGNNTNIVNFYCGGHDQAILIRQNNVIMNTWYVDSSFNNSIGLDYQSVGGGCEFTNGRINGLTSGSVCVRVWNVSLVEMRIQCIGDGGSNTSTMYTAPNSTAGVPNSAQGWYGTLRNGGNGLNASPATLTVA